MKKIKEIWANPKVKFGIVSFIYIVWFVVWTQNLWWLLGLLPIYDYYFTRYIDKIYLDKYRALKAKSKTGKIALEWVEALLYAVVVVVPLKLYFFGMYIIPTSSMEGTLLVGDFLFVNKLEYGPRMANTPVSFPFVQHTLPFTTNTRSWLGWLSFDYKRLKGFSEIKNDDVVVFNFPAGDTVALYQPNSTYYDIIRREGRAAVEAQSKIIYRPIDKRENYIKRCVAIAGDSLQIVEGVVRINGKAQRTIAGLQYMYIVTTDGTQFSDALLRELGVNVDADEASYDPQAGNYFLFLTAQNAAKIKSKRSVTGVERYVNTSVTSAATFPHRPDLYPWNEDNFGPIWVPRAGATVPITVENLPLYERIIKNYELNTLAVRDSTITINGKVATNYTFKMNYYFMMGDNRHNSLDSRYWGFVPEDHIEGKASTVWFSLTPGKSIFSGIRWIRMFNSIE